MIRPEKPPRIIWLSRGEGGRFQFWHRFPSRFERRVPYIPEATVERVKDWAMETAPRIPDVRREDWLDGYISACLRVMELLEGNDGED